MPRRGDAEFVKDINEAIGRIKLYSNGMTYEAFLLDTKTQDAVIRNLEIIGGPQSAYLPSSGRGTRVSDGRT